MESLKVEVCYALPRRQFLVSLRVPPGTTLMEAVQRSGVAAEFPGLDLGALKFGVHGKSREAHEQVKAGDRVELYRELTADPKAARHQRVAKARKKARNK